MPSFFLSFLKFAHQFNGVFLTDAGAVLIDIKACVLGALKLSEFGKKRGGRVFLSLGCRGAEKKIISSLLVSKQGAFARKITSVKLSAGGQHPLKAFKAVCKSGSF